MASDRKKRWWQMRYACSGCHRSIRWWQHMDRETSLRGVTTYWHKNCGVM